MQLSPRVEESEGICTEQRRSNIALFDSAQRDLPRIANSFDTKQIRPHGVATGNASLTPRINVVLNWFEELKQRVPTGENRSGRGRNRTAAAPNDGRTSVGVTWQPWHPGLPIR